MSLPKNMVRPDLRRQIGRDREAPLEIWDMAKEAGYVSKPESGRPNAFMELPKT